MSASTVAFEMTLITMLLRNEYLFRKKCTFKIQLVNTAKNCILYFYFQHVVLYIKFIEIKN